MRKRSRPDGNDRLGLTMAAKLAVVSAVASLARVTRRGGGTSLPGRLLLALEPQAVRILTQRLPGGCVVISATNGKTTTAAMAASVLERNGTRLVHNHAGANMAGGVASALVSAAGVGRPPEADLGLFEVDEFWLGHLVAQLRPRTVLLGNLFRDQLDRYGELEAIADRWAQAATGSMRSARLVLNADDPLVADLRSSGDPGGGVSYFGVEDAGLGRPGLEHAADAKHCRRCGTAYRFDVIFLGHLGHYHCPGCGAGRPQPEMTAERVRLRGLRGASFDLCTPEGSERVELSAPGLYNVYNALGAAALCRSLGVALRDVVSGLENAAPAFGRAETIEVRGRPVVVLLVKNPAGTNEVLRTLALEGDGLDVMVALNDNAADGRDVSWIWDADFEGLASTAARVTCSGSRAAEMALRLKYAGMDQDRIHAIPEVEAAFDNALAEGSGTLHVLPTYTALLSLRDLLAARGLAAPFWA